MRKGALTPPKDAGVVQGQEFSVAWWRARGLRAVRRCPAPRRQEVEVCGDGVAWRASLLSTVVRR